MTAEEKVQWEAELLAVCSPSKIAALESKNAYEQLSQEATKNSMTGGYDELECDTLYAEVEEPDLKRVSLETDKWPEAVYDEAFEFDPNYLPPKNGGETINNQVDEGLSGIPLSISGGGSYNMEKISPEEDAVFSNTYDSPAKDNEPRAENCLPENGNMIPLPEASISQPYKPEVPQKPMKTNLLRGSSLHSSPKKKKLMHDASKNIMQIQHLHLEKKTTYDTEHSTEVIAINCSLSHASGEDSGSTRVHLSSFKGLGHSQKLPAIKRKPLTPLPNVPSDLIQYHPDAKLHVPPNHKNDISVGVTCSEGERSKVETRTILQPNALNASQTPFPQKEILQSSLILHDKKPGTVAISPSATSDCANQKPVSCIQKPPVPARRPLTCLSSEDQVCPADGNTQQESRMTSTLGKKKPVLLSSHHSNQKEVKGIFWPSFFLSISIFIPFVHTVLYFSITIKRSSFVISRENELFNRNL